MYLRVVENGWYLKYFKYKHGDSALPLASLPEPNGSLRKKVPSKAIELANAEMTR